MAKPLDAKEARERIEDRLRSHGADKSSAQKQADASVGRVYDQKSKQNAGQKRR